MKAKKSLGQHFLHSEKALSQIITAADIQDDDVILEIGPGKGILTLQLVAFAGKVIAVEKDRDMVSLLEAAFEESIGEGRLEIIEGDILKFNPARLPKGAYKLVANIPYYITGAIIEKFLSVEHQPSTMVLLMQKEVAERIVARDKKQSILSIAVKAYGVPKLIARVPAGAFNPPPKVDSAILRIEGISRSFFEGCDETLFFEVLKAVFGKKRKQIGGSLSDFAGKERSRDALMQSDIDSKARPEDLTLEDWKKLAVALAETKNSVQ